MYIIYANIDLIRQLAN